MSWPRVALGEIAELHAGCVFPPRLQGRRSGDVPFAKVGDISRAVRSQSDELLSPVNYISLEEAKELRARILPAGTTVFAKIGEAISQNYRLCLLTPAIVDNNAMGATPRSGVADPRFLFHFLCTIDLYALASKTAVPAVRKSDLERLPVPLPPMAEQRRIADILDKAGAIRRKRKEAIALTEELLRATFLEMFGDPVTNPKQWETARLASLLSFLTSGSRGWAQYYADEGALFLRIQNVVGDQLVLDDVARVQAPDSAEARRTLVEPGDVLLSITADLGRVTTVPAGIGPAHINQHLAILRPTSRIVPEYLSAYLNSTGGQRQFQRLNRHGVKAGLNFDDIRGVDVLVPPYEFQQAFAARKVAIRRTRDVARDALRRAEELFASLVDRAFSGLDSSQGHLEAAC